MSGASPRKLRLLRGAQRGLNKRPAAELPKIAVVLDSLRHDPYPASSTRLAGFTNAYAIDIGTTRIFYIVEASTVWVPYIGDQILPPTV